MSEQAQPQPSPTGDLNVALSQERMKSSQLAEQLQSVQEELASLRTSKESEQESDKSELQRAQERIKALEQENADNKKLAKQVTKASKARLELTKYPLHENAGETALRLLDLDKVGEDAIADAVKSVIDTNPYLVKSEQEPAFQFGAGSSNPGDAGAPSLDSDLARTQKELQKQAQRLGILD